MKKYNLVAEHLVEGQKITLVYQGEFGGMSVLPTTYLGCQAAPHYQDCPTDMIGVAILHRPRGKRQAGYKTISYNVPLIVYDGWQSFNANSIVFKPLGDNMQVSRYAMHDKQFFVDLLGARPDGVIFADIEVGSDG